MRLDSSTNLNYFLHTGRREQTIMWIVANLIYNRSMSIQYNVWGLHQIIYNENYKNLTLEYMVMDQ